MQAQVELVVLRALSSQGLNIWQMFLCWKIQNANRTKSYSVGQNRKEGKKKERRKKSERFICAYRLKTLYSLTNLL